MSVLSFLFGEKTNDVLPCGNGMIEVGISYREANVGDIIGYGDKAYIMGEDRLLRLYDIETGQVDNSMAFDKIPNW